MTASNVIHFPTAPTSDESTHAAAHRHVGADFLANAAQPNHFVQFYEDEEFLFEMVGKFLGAGIRAGDRLLVIATPEHRDGFLRRLESSGAHAAIRDGQLTLLDARETLAHFMVDGNPDPTRFRALLSQVMGKVKGSLSTTCVRAYGEMVDLLWRDGNAEAAIRLEELWNDAGNDHAFSLFCAYVIGNFYKEGDSSQFFQVCKHHSHIIPPEAISRQRALEKELAHRAELEEALRAALRKRTDAEEDLRNCLRREQEARAAAEAGIEFRELFVGMLGHDLRNPLNTMLNTARVLLLRNEVVPEGKKRVERMITSGLRMERMIEQLLDLTRERLAGGISVEPQFQDVDSLVTKIVNEARAAHGSRDLRYEKLGDCWAEVDGDRFEQVVSNLVANAIAHGSIDGPVCVLLTGSALTIQLSVQNEGTPIAPETMGHLFDPFKQEKKREGRSEGLGLGLGLFIVERIVKAHNGIIDVASSAERGTIFEATFPKRGHVKTNG